MAATESTVEQEATLIASRRVLYQPWTEYLRARVGANNLGQYKVVASVNLTPDDFRPRSPMTHLKDLNPTAARLMSVFFNVAAYFTGRKPYTVMNASGLSDGHGMVVVRPLLSHTKTVLGLNFMILSRGHLSLATRDAMEATVTSARAVARARSAAKKAESGTKKKTKKKKTKKNRPSKKQTKGSRAPSANLFDDAARSFDDEEEEDAADEQHSGVDHDEDDRGLQTRTKNKQRTKGKKRTLGEVADPVNEDEEPSGAAPPPPSKRQKRRHQRRPSAEIAERLASNPFMDIEAAGSDNEDGDEEDDDDADDDDDDEEEEDDDDPLSQGFGHGLFQAALSLHVIEGAYVRKRYEKMSKALAAEIFGKNQPKPSEWHPRFRYLQDTLQTLVLSHIMPYYSNGTSKRFETDKRALDSNAMRAIGFTDYNIEQLLAQVFTVADSFVYNCSLRGLAPEFYRLDALYDRLDWGHLALQQQPDPNAEDAMDLEDAGVSTQDWVPTVAERAAFFEALQLQAKELCSQGAPVPDHFPYQDTVVVVAPEFTMPELLMDRPLPFPLCKLVDPTLYTPAIADLVDGNKEIYARVLVEVGNYDGRHTGEEQLSYLTEAFTEMVGNSAGGTAEGTVYDHVRLYRQLEKQANEELRALQQRELTANQVTRLVEWARHQEDRLRALLFKARQPLIDGRYPGMLTPSFSLREQAETGRANGVRILQRAVSEDGTVDLVAHPRYNVTEEEARRMFPDLRDEDIVSVGIGDESNPGSAGYGASNDELLKMAMELKPEAGRYASYNAQIVQTSALVQLRIIHEAERAQLLRRLAQSGASYDEMDEQVRNQVWDQARRTDNVMRNTENEAATMLRIRKSAFLLFQRDCTIPLQPMVNGSYFQTFLSFVVNTLVTPFKVSPQTQPIVMILYFAMKDHLRLPDISTGMLHTSVIVGGVHSTGKSYGLWLVQLVHLEGSCINAAHITTHALTTGENNSYNIFLQHEGQMSQFVDPTAGKNGGTESGADSTKAQIFKTMMTEMCITTVALEIDDETRQRHLKTHTSLASNVFGIAVNWPLSLASQPILSRFIVLETRSLNNAYLPGQSSTTQLRPKNVDQATEFYENVRQHHMMHAMHMLVEWHMTSGSCPNDVLSDMSDLFVEKVTSLLHDKYAFQRAEPRVKQFIAAIARIMCIYSAIFELIALEPGRQYLHEHKVSPTSVEAMVGFIFPRLAITVEHATSALTLLESQLGAPYLTPIMLSMAHQLKVETPVEQAPLLVPVKELAGDVENHKYFGYVDAASLDTMPLHSFFERPRGARTPVHRPVHVDDSMHHEDDVGGDDGIGGTPAAPVAARHPQADLNKPLQIGQSFNERYTQDQRYLTVTVPTVEQAALEVVKTIQDLANFEIRKEAVQKVLENKARHHVESPYYLRDPRTRRLHVMADQVGVERMDLIPVVMIRDHPTEMRARKPMKQVGIAVAFLLQCLGVCVAEGDDKRLYRIMEIEKADRETQDVFRERISQPPRERLKLPYVDESEITPEWASKWVKANAFSEPLVMAITWVLENNTLHVTKGDGPGPMREMDLANPMANYLIFFPPKSLILRVDGMNGRKNLIHVNMSSFLSVLSVKRTETETKMVFVNQSRAKHTALFQIEASQAHYTRNVTKRSEYIRYLQALGTYVDRDIDFIQCSVRMQTLGMPRIPWLDKVVDNAGFEHDVPYTYPIIRNGIYRFLFAHRTTRQKQLAAREGKPIDMANPAEPRRASMMELSYPAEDVLLEARQASHVMHETTTGQYHHLQSQSSLLLRPLVAQTPSASAPRPSDESRTAANTVPAAAIDENSDDDDEHEDDDGDMEELNQVLGL